MASNAVKGATGTGAANGTSEANGTNGTNGTTPFPALHTSADEFLKHDYDFVIVGGGTAGLVVAARLTENPNVSVGVLEAGSNRLDDPNVDIPALHLSILNHPDYDWQFMSEPQAHNANRRHNLVRGKALGGSSALNFMMYVRGSTQDYDDWAALSGDESWNAENMMKYMRKHQTLDPIDDSVTERKTMPFVGEHHGTSGPIHTSFNPWRLPVEDDFILACDEVTGLKNKPLDPWSGDHIGFYNTLGAVSRTGPNKGKRSYAAREYFAANARRPNLHVLCDALVKKVMLDGKRATGVEFSHDGQTHIVNSKKEVIISAGVIQSPQVLELSGIGNPDIIRAAGVEPKIENRAIGENLQDHVYSGVSWQVKPGVQTLEAMYQPGAMEAIQKELGETQSGPLTCIASMQGFFPYKKFATQAEHEQTIKSIEDSLPHVTPFQRKQYERTIALLKDDKSASAQIVFVANRWGQEQCINDQSKAFPPPESPDSPWHVSAGACWQFPLSRGTVHIKSSDPTVPPAMDPRYLSHPADVDGIATIMKMLDAAGKTSHMSDKVEKRAYPKPEVNMDDTEAVRELVRNLSTSEYHLAGSIAMGDAVDSSLKVIGTDNIRVIDASIFPNQVSGNILSTVYALAEKGADIIKDHWQNAALKKAAAA